MYAVIRTGGKQYRVTQGDVIEVEHLVSKGNKVSLVPVLVVTDDGNTIYGKKELKAFTVSAKIVGDAKGDKINVLKYRPKSGYTAHTGHRQLYSLIEISSIGPGAGEKKAEAPKAEAPKAEAPKAEAPIQDETPAGDAETASDAGLLT